MNASAKGFTAMVKSSPLHKVTDDARWDAEDLFGRLCIVTHAAFIYAGFHPSSPPAETRWSLSRSYSVLRSQAARDDQDEAAVELRLSGPWERHRKRRAYMALRAYVTANGGRYMEHKERLDRAALETILSGSVEDAARTLRSPGSTGEWLWKLLADAICRGLFLYACEVNGVPVMPDFHSLPSDVKMVILEKLEDGKDVAMAESASKDLRDLVAEHDSDLWKAKYEAITGSCPYYFRWNHIMTDEDTPLVTWKERYVMARQSEWIPAIHPPRTIRETMILLGMTPKPRRSIRKVIHETWKPGRAAVEEKTKYNQAGAVHSPSSRYHWKHR